MGHGLRHGPLVAPAQHPRLPLQWKRTPARPGRRQESHQDFRDLKLYLRSVPRDLSLDFSISRIDYLWDYIPGRDQIFVRLALGLRNLLQACRPLQKAWIRAHPCLPRLCRPPPEGADRVLVTSRTSREVVSCAALGLLGHPPVGGVPRYPPMEVLRARSRPDPGSCRRAVSLLTGGFPHISPTSGPAPRGTGGGISPRA